MKNEQYKPQRSTNLYVFLQPSCLGCQIRLVGRCCSPRSSHQFCQNNNRCGNGFARTINWEADQLINLIWGSKQQYIVDVVIRRASSNWGRCGAWAGLCRVAEAPCWSNDVSQLRIVPRSRIWASAGEQQMKSGGCNHFNTRLRSPLHFRLCRGAWLQRVARWYMVGHRKYAGMMIAHGALCSHDRGPPGDLSLLVLRT